jgi:hypothetical protein
VEIKPNEAGGFTIHLRPDGGITSKSFGENVKNAIYFYYGVKKVTLTHLDDYLVGITINE